MKALALFGALAAAKLLAVAGRDLPWSGWTPLAVFWQDALVALIFGALDLALRRKPAWSWVLFWLIVLYTAVNVPLARILSSPLTWQMSRATGGALADSVSHYFTWATLAQMLIVLGAAVGCAKLAQRVAPTGIRVGLALLVLVSLVGAFAAQRVDCSGFHRNALVAFTSSTWPRIQGVAAHDPADWRGGAGTGAEGAGLQELRGVGFGRNVVLVSLESTGARYLRCYGANLDPTPNLTRFAGHSIIFENAYAVTPESIKGLFSVLCSRYPAFDTSGEDYASVRTPALAEILSSAGYRTALMHSGRFMYLGMNAVVRRRGFDTLEDAGAIGGNFESSFGVDEPSTVQRMLAWIDLLPRGQRFLLHYLPIAGHHPYETPEPGPFPDSNDAQQYLNALHFGDAALGLFLDGLRLRGLETNTLFVIYGDHGEAFGQHQGNFGHTLFLYEENVHVPLLIALPGALTETKRVKHVASLIDVAPTILDLLGLEMPPDYQGISLLAPRDCAALFYTDYSLPLAGARDGRFKLFTELGARPAKLFDLEIDPAETRNIAAQHPEFVAAWKHRLTDWAAAQKWHILPRNGASEAIASQAPGDAFTRVTSRHVSVEQNTGN